MDSFHKFNDRSASHKNKPSLSTKAQSRKSPNDTSFNESESQLKAILNQLQSNKRHSSTSKQRSSKCSGSFLSSTQKYTNPFGKENKSSSPKRKLRVKTPSGSQAHEQKLKLRLNSTLGNLKNSTELNGICPSNTTKKAQHTQIPSGLNMSLTSTLHRRYNSSAAAHHSRAGSNEKRSTHGIRSLNNTNNSMFNNSLMIEDPLNCSREYSYLKEYDTSEFTNLNELTGFYNSSLKIAGSTEKSHLGFEAFGGKNACPTAFNEDEDPVAQIKPKSILRKGRDLFKQKRYQEAIESLKDYIEREGEKPDALFLLGLSYLWLGQYQEAKTELTKIVEKEDYVPKCSVFILLSVVYKKIDDNASAVKILTKAITKYPERSDIYIFRAKLFLKLKDWERAASDFDQAVQIDPSRAIGYIGKGDAFRMLLEHNKAVSAYTKAVDLQTPLSTVALLKRAIAYTEMKNYEEAIIDLDIITSEDPKHSEAYYFKGLILEKKKDLNEAVLCFEQAVKHNSSEKAVLKSLYEITRIKIEERNFYEALHTLQRSELMGLDQAFFKKLKLLTEGVIHLMKKKFDSGVANLTEVLTHHLSTSLICMVYTYRAYGYFCLGKIKSALYDYQEVQKLTKLDKACSYNKLLCEGILAAERRDFDLAESSFNKAMRLYNNKMEPYFYKGVIAVEAFRKSHQKDDKAKLASCLVNALKDLDKALSINQNCSSLHYVKAVILYVIDELDMAYACIEKAIEKADEHYAKYYFLKGAIYAAAGNYYHAISNLSTAINLDKNYRPAYLERGKCYFALCEIKEVFLDIQTYTSIKGNDPNIHLWAGNLLFSTGAYEDAARAYSNSENINKSETLLALRAKCYIVLKEPTLALKDLDKLVELQTPNNVHYYIDKKCLHSIMFASTPNQETDDIDTDHVAKAALIFSKILSYKMSGEIFHLDDLYFYKSVLHFYLKEYDQAIDDLDTAWDFRRELNLMIEGQRQVGKEVSKDHIKISENFGLGSDHKKHDDDQEKKSTFNSLEYFYNKAIYLLMAERYQESAKLLEHLRDMLTSTETRQKLDTLLRLIQIQCLRGTQNKDSFNVTTKLKSQEIVLFPYENRLCSLFPSFKLPLVSNTIYESRLSFCFPAIDPPSMVPSPSFDVLDDLTVKAVENRPEAPWIKRSSEGVVFTRDAMQNEEKDIPNLKEVILANGLNEEEVYSTLSKSKLNLLRKQKPLPEPDDDIDEVIEYPWETPKQEPMPTDKLLAKNFIRSDPTILRSKTEPM